MAAARRSLLLAIGVHGQSVLVTVPKQADDTAETEMNEQAEKAKSRNNEAAKSTKSNLKAKTI